MKVKIHRNKENDTFEFVAIVKDGHEGVPIKVASDDIPRAIFLIACCGHIFPPYQHPTENSSTEEFYQGYSQYYLQMVQDWLDRNEGKTLEVFLGLVNGQPCDYYGVCNKCGGLHLFDRFFDRRFFDKDTNDICNNERYEWDRTTKQMVLKPYQPD